MHRKMWFFLANFPNLVGGKMKVLKVERLFLGEKKVLKSSYYLQGKKIINLPYLENRF
jgi:hypothetical protein